MNRGYSWEEFKGACREGRITNVVKRRVNIPGERLAYECIACGSVFKRKHVRWVGQGWLCRDRCERAHKGLP